jgi:hypothetical protein
MRRTVVVATVTLAAALAAVTSPASASASLHAFGPVSAKDDPGLAAAQQILSLIPQGDRERCQQIDATDALGGDYKAATAGVFCGDPLSPAAATVLYFRYATTAKLNRDYLRSVPDGTPKSSDTDHSLCDGTNTWRFADHVKGGKDACFIVGGTTPHMVWTTDRALLLGIAEGVDPSDGIALKKWWNGSAGPLEQPAQVTNFGTGTRRQYDAAEQRLRANVSKNVKGCKSTLGLISKGDFDWGFFPWIQGSVNCTGPDDGNVLLVKLDPRSAQAFARNYVDNFLGNASDPRSTPAGCEAKDLLDANQKRVGEVSCVMVGEHLYANWYATDTGVVGSLELDTTPAAMFQYLDQNSLL